MIAWSPTLRDDSATIDMRVDAPQPWCRFNLSYQHGRIPVPQLAENYSDSVQGIVEALALVARPGQPGKIAPGYFFGPGRPRKIREGHWCIGWRVGTKPVSLRVARQELLIPAYLWLLHRRLETPLRRLDEMARSQTLYLFDGSDNIDIEDPAPFSAAAIVVALLSGTLRQFTEGDVSTLPR